MSSVSVAAQTPTQATVAYIGSAGVAKAYVLDITGNTITPGTVKSVDASATLGSISLTVLNTTQLLCTYLLSTATVTEVVFTISASVISLSTTATALTGVSGSVWYETLTISPSKVLSAMINSGTSSAVRMRLQSITAGVPAAVGSQITLDGFGLGQGLQFGMQLVSGDRVLLAQILSGKNGVVLILLDVSGTTPSILRTRILPACTDDTAALALAKLNGVDILYLTWVGESRGVDSVPIKIGADNSINISAVSRYVDSSLASGLGYIDVCPMSADKVMSVCRNSSSYLSYKPVGISL